MSAPPEPLIAAPMTKADSENIAAKISSPMAGARQLPNRRRRRKSNAIFHRARSRLRQVGL